MLYSKLEASLNGVTLIHLDWVSIVRHRLLVLTRLTVPMAMCPWLCAHGYVPMCYVLCAHGYVHRIPH